jgi:hypothetical protein
VPTVKHDAIKHKTVDDHPQGDPILKNPEKADAARNEPASIIEND